MPTISDMFRAILILTFAFVAVSRAEHVRVELVASRTAVQPGHSVDVAVVLTIDPEWHVYWINPGDTGAPPRLKWTLPPGVTAEPLRFPTPSRIDAGGGLTAFGYQTQVALLTTIRVPAEATGSVELAGTLSCVVCKDVCLQERHPVSLLVPIGTSEAAHSEQFAKWTAALPAKADGYRAVTWAKDGGGSLDYPLHDGETGIDFFPPAADNLEYAKPTEIVADGRRVYRLSFKKTGGETPTDIGTAVVVVRLPNGSIHSSAVHYGSAPANRPLTQE